MNEFSNKRSVIVGIFVFLGLALLIAGVLIVGNLHETFKKKMKIVSLFDEVNGLQKGNNVWFSGVKIGIVASLRYYGKAQVEVTMKVESTAQQYIRKDAKVKISTDGFIGNKILVIYGGSSKSEQVEEGDTLKVENTVSTDDMIKTLQQNNQNFLAISSNFKIISEKLASGDGTIGKLINDNSLYSNISNAAAALQVVSQKAKQLVSSIDTFSAGLNKKGTLAYGLTSDTVVFRSVKTSILQFQQMADTASVFVANLKNASANPNTSIGVLLHDEESGNHLKSIIKNLESSSKKLDEDLEAAQHNFLLRGFFKKKAKESKSNPSR